MAIAETFFAYAHAFEQTFVDDDWSRIEPFFAPGIVYLTGEGEEIRGRADVVAYLKQSLDEFDRRFDSRSAGFASDPVVTDNKVSFEWRVAYAREGVPDVVIIGTEVATFEDGVIARLEDTVEPEMVDVLQAWIEKHGEFLAVGGGPDGGSEGIER